MCIYFLSCRWPFLVFADVANLKNDVMIEKITNMADITVPQNIDPASKIRNLSVLGSAVSVENDVPARRYLRSGLEMERMVKLMSSFCIFNNLLFHGVI